MRTVRGFAPKTVVRATLVEFDEQVDRKPNAPLADRPGRSATRDRGGPTMIEALARRRSNRPVPIRRPGAAALVGGGRRKARRRCWRRPVFATSVDEDAACWRCYRPPTLICLGTAFHRSAQTARPATPNVRAARGRPKREASCRRPEIERQ